MCSHPSEKVGRNDPCVCGSGKKYKRCCLMNRQVPETSPWQLQRDASDRLADEFLKFTRRRFEGRLTEAWQDFNQRAFPKFMDEYPGEEQIFFPYFFFEWDPERPRWRRGQRLRPGMIARAFLEEKARRLSELERLILEQSVSQPTSFYEVLQCEPGRGMRLRDVLIGGETEVEEHSGSRFVQPGDLAYARVCRLPDVATLTCMAPHGIPPRMKAEVIMLRVWLRQKAAKQNREPGIDDLFRYADRIRSTYLSLRDSLHAPPRLANTDGDPLEFHTLTFRVGSAQVAFDALAPLAWGWSKEELLEDAEIDADGTLRRVAIDWVKKGNKMHEHWDNTILGHMKIAERSLVVDVNSAERAARIREEINERLGMMAVHLGTRVRTPEQIVKEAHQDEPAEAMAEQADTPELNEMTQAFMQTEMEAWVYKRIPILGGRTPMEAVADPDAREIVESLLLDWERNAKRTTNARIGHPDVGALRRLLNLPGIETAK